MSGKDHGMCSFPWEKGSELDHEVPSICSTFPATQVGHTDLHFPEGKQMRVAKLGKTWSKCIFCIQQCGFMQPSPTPEHFSGTFLNKYMRKMFIYQGQPFCETGISHLMLVLVWPLWSLYLQSQVGATKQP